MTWLAVAICTLAAAFFAGLETGLISANQFSLYTAREKRILYARAADFLLLKPERLLSTTLIGTNIAVVTATVLLSRYLRETGMGWAAWVGSAALALMMLIVAEIIPKSFFRQNADTVAVRLAPALVLFYYLFFPVAIVLNVVVKVLLFVTGQLRPTKAKLDSKHSLRTLVRLGSREAGIPLEDQRIVEDIFDFQDTMAREVMIHIHQTLACPASLPVEEIVRQALSAEVRFVPIYRHRLDNLIGYIDLEELVTAASLSMNDLMHVPVFYPDTKRIPDLYVDMTARNLTVVFLSNEYGRVSGIITPTEIVAEIVGSRPGSKDSRRREIEHRGDGSYTVVGVTDVEDFRNETGIALPAGPYDTVGGFLLTRLGRIPETGESLDACGATFTVIDRDDVHVKKIKVRPATAT
ncbi:MAG: hemolysin family protein [Spirochaetia bacterium]